MRQSIFMKALLRADEDHPARALLSSLQCFVLNLEPGLREVRELPVRIVTVRTPAEDHHYLSFWIDTRITVEPKFRGAYSVANEDYIADDLLRRRESQRHELISNFKRICFANCFNLNSGTIFRLRRSRREPPDLKAVSLT